MHADRLQQRQDAGHRQHEDPEAAFGPRAGHKVLSLRTVAGQDEKPRKVRCADAHGFSLHAAVRCGADQRMELERLCRYVTRPAIANRRLRESAMAAVGRIRVFEPLA
jgi:hypothetical protein